jgi:heterodisulfide reductase subunit C
MAVNNLPRTSLKYEEELDGRFGDEIASTPGGGNLHSCIQCGNCSGGCPVSLYMDYTPRRIIAMTRAGFKKEVLNSHTIWLCASCYNCTVECPREIKITDIMYALKQRAIKEGVHPRRFAIPTLAREFFGTVMRYGRNHESELLVRMYLKTNPFAMLKQATLGLKLFLRGRMPIFPEKIKSGGKGDLRTIMRALEKKP